MKDDIQKTRKRLQELKELHFTGFLDDAQYAEAVAVLERKLIDAVMLASNSEIKPPAPPAEPAMAAPVEAAPPKPREAPLKPPARAKRRIPVFGGLALAVVLLVVGGYGWLALRPASKPAWNVMAGRTAAERQAMGPQQLAATADRLNEHLKTHPKDVEAWITLAHVQTDLGRHPESAAAYERASALRENDAALLADYAEARAMTSNGNISGRPLELVQRALKLDPTNLKALSLAGTAAYDRKDYSGALTYWEKLIEVAPADDPLARKARSNVAETRQLAVGTVAGASAPAVPPASTTVVASGGHDIRGTVTLAPALRQKVSPTDTVFVYARAVSGPPVPLAVLRKQAKDLPLEFKFDDSLAMWESAKVSTAGQVVVTARISKSGEAQPQAGDLQGQSVPVAAGVSGLRVEIGEVVKK